MLTNGLFQAFEMASVIVTQRDLGCQATGVIHLDEGVNTDSLQAAEFWSILGGQTHYKGKRHNRKFAILNTFISQNCSDYIYMFMCVFLSAGPDSADDDDEHYERAITESNCIYRLQEDRLSPQEQGWAVVPDFSLLDSSQVLVTILLKNE